MNDARDWEEQSLLDNAPRVPARGGLTKIRRFDGLSRRTADWDGLRKDAQLWDDEADCLVHFYAHGTSQRGASLRVPYEAVRKLDCPHLSACCLQPRSDTPLSTSDSNRDSGYSSDFSETGQLHNLYIAAPQHLSRTELFSHHIVTRNVIAYAVGRPIVGEKLSVALVNLWKRLRAWKQGRASRRDFTSYLHQQGYLSLTENAEHALACLKFAEEAQFRDIWINAFSHCAGMHERLDLSPEFAGISKTTIALLTRASLEMDLHISRVTKALGGFLEEQLGPEYLGLSKPARDHLDHFRSFLHAHYVDKFGWFPPPHRQTWNKRPWREMYRDFQCLYEYLVDSDSSQDWAAIRGATGGICVIQNIQAFDARHGYEPLPHPLALLPQSPNVKRRRSITSQTALRNFKLGKAATAPEPIITPYQALAIATNPPKTGEPPRQLTQEYQRFERQQSDAKLDNVEGRKVRWLLVYSVLQMLASIMKGPKEVIEAEAASYPVCVLTHGCPVFDVDADADAADATVPDDSAITPKASLIVDTLDALEGRSSRISIHPDCEADCADDFFAATAISRRESELSLNQLALQNRPGAPLSRTGSFRTSMQFGVHAFQKSWVGSLNRRNSKRIVPVAEPRHKASHCEIVVEDYGNGLFMKTNNTSRPQTAVRVVDGATLEATDQLQDFDFGFASVAAEEPVLDHTQLEIITSGLDTMQFVEQSSRDSQSSATSGTLLDSNRSSYAPYHESDDTDLSSMNSDDDKWDSVNSSPVTPVYAPELKSLSEELLKEDISYRPQSKKGDFGVSSACWSVNAGCYTPTGLIVPPKSKFASQERPSSSRSTTSSDYAEEGTQAADIEEVELRGRQRSRAMDNFARRRPAGDVMLAY